jgi:hypothetical protein
LGWEKEGEMTQTLYAHMNKIKIKKSRGGGFWGVIRSWGLHLHKWASTFTKKAQRSILDAFTLLPCEDTSRMCHLQGAGSPQMQIDLGLAASVFVRNKFLVIIN